MPNRYFTPHNSFIKMNKLRITRNFWKINSTKEEIFKRIVITLRRDPKGCCKLKKKWLLKSYSMTRKGIDSKK